MYSLLRLPYWRWPLSPSLNLSFQGYAPWTTDLHTYSVEDFLEVKSGNKMKYLRAMLADGVSHVKNCPLCMGKGFVCEVCSDQDIIYPFESTLVNVCQGKCVLCVPVWGGGQGSTVCEGDYQGKVVARVDTATLENIV